jgi:HEAT repeat protein
LFLVAITGLPLPTCAQTSPSLTILLQTCIERANAGDSAATFNAVLNLAEALGKAPLSDVKEVLPDIMQAVDDKNPAVRTLALDSIVAIESRSNPDHSLRGDALPLLEPEIPRIADHLADDDTHIRSTTASVLGGFVIKPPDAVFAPLIAYLKREDAVGSVGSSVVFDLVRLGPQRPAVAAAIIAFISRPDQTPDGLISSIDAIAHAQTHNEEIDTAAARNLDIPKAAVRIAVIRDLPELQLPDEVFAATQTHLRQIAANDQEDPAVRAAANTILPCWVNDRHKPCPAFTLPSPTPASSSEDDSGQR